MNVHTDIGAVTLAESIAENKTLHHLELGSNPLGLAGILALKYDQLWDIEINPTTECVESTKNHDMNIALVYPYMRLICVLLSFFCLLMFFQWFRLYDSDAAAWHVDSHTMKVNTCLTELALDAATDSDRYVRPSESLVLWFF